MTVDISSEAIRWEDIRSNLALLDRNPRLHRNSKKLLVNEREADDELRKLMFHFASKVGKTTKEPSEEGQEAISFESKLNQAFTEVQSKFGDQLENSFNKLLTQLGRALTTTLTAIGQQYEDLCQLTNEQCNQVKDIIHDFCQQLFVKARKPLPELITKEVLEELHPNILRLLDEYAARGEDLPINIPINLVLKQDNHSLIATEWKVTVKLESSERYPFKKDRQSKEIADIMPSMIVKLENTSPKWSPYNQVREISYEIDDAACDIHDPYPEITNTYFRDKEALRLMKIEFMDGSDYSYKRPKDGEIRLATSTEPVQTLLAVPRIGQVAAAT